MCCVGRAESKSGGREQPTLQGWGGKKKQVNDRLSKRKCLKRLRKGAVCSHTGCKM